MQTDKINGKTIHWCLEYGESCFPVSDVSRTQSSWRRPTPNVDSALPARILGKEKVVMMYAFVTGDCQKFDLYTKNQPMLLFTGMITIKVTILYTSLYPVIFFGRGTHTHLAEGCAIFLPPTVPR